MLLVSCDVWLCYICVPCYVDLSTVDVRMTRLLSCLNCGEYVMMLSCVICCDVCISDVIVANVCFIIVAIVLNVIDCVSLCCCWDVLTLFR